MMKRGLLMATLCLAAALGPIPVLAQQPTLQDLMREVPVLPEIVIYPAREIITLDPSKPEVEAVAVVDDRILATGSLRELTAAVGDQPYRIDRTFEDQVIVPGFLAQHDHPLLAGLTMMSEVIAMEDWVLPGRTFPAAGSREEYLARLAEAESGMEDPDELLLSWGYHHYFHGRLTKADLDAVSSTRPIIIWHRSAHEFFLNSAAEERYGVTREWWEELPEAARAQSDFENAHYWEQGWFAVLPLTAAAVATPDRVRRGLELVKEYYHAAGVTLGSEPGGIASKAAQDAQNAVLGVSSSPFRFYYIIDGKSITAAHPDEAVAAESDKMMSWGEGMTAFLPKRVKLFADGAVYSQAMQMTDGYTNDSHGEWMMEPELFARTFRLYWDLGYQLHIHVTGDAGVDLALDHLELNMRRNPRFDHRTVLIHFAVSRPDQVERIRRLGALVSGNPYYPVVLSDNYRVNGLEPERADPMVRMGDVERAGISYSFHSDMPMAPGQPLYLMWSGVNRVTLEGNLRAPEQRVSRQGALRAVTLDAAYSLGLEDQVGSIEAGKLANFTILAENPVTVDPMAIKDITVWGTVQEGRVLPAPGTVDGDSGATGPGPVPEADGVVPPKPRAGDPDAAGRPGSGHPKPGEIERALVRAIWGGG
jgi:predicted amidohydrolase YtcJ